MNPNEQAGTSRDWAAMARLPNIPTVWSNVFTAWVIGNGLIAVNGWNRLAGVLLAGSLIYIGGTILNDVADVEFDRRFRPERPIPAGRVSRKSAAQVAAAALLMGSLLFLRLGAPVLAVLTLLAFILGYTKAHKKYPLTGACLMGLCRLSLCVTVGLATGGFDNRWPIVLFFYIFCVSWLAQGESRPTKADGVFGAYIAMFAIPWLLAVPGLSVYSTQMEWSMAIWLGLLLVWVVAMWWVGFPLRGNGRGFGRSAAVGRALAVMPLIDAIFLMVHAEGGWIFIPLICVALALGLRCTASAT